MPYVEQDTVFKQFALTAAADDERNRAAADNRFRFLVCPSSGEYDRGDRGERWKSSTPLTHYVGVAGVGVDAATLPTDHPRAGAFGYFRQISLNRGDISDGTSNTFLVIETGHNPGHWAFGGPATVRGIEPEAAPLLGPGRPFGGFHDGGREWFRERTQLCNVAMADGSVRTFTDAVAPEVLAALTTVGGKEQLPADW